MTGFADLRVRCTACDGTGHAPIDLVLVEALVAIRELERDARPITAPEVMGRLRVEPRWKPGATAINNRLERLVHHGFLRRIGRHGKRIRYELVREALHANPGWRT